MEYVTGTAAPTLAADAFVRGQKRFSLALSEYRGTWAVVAYAPRHAEVLELAKLEEAFGADGAIVLATTPDGLARGTDIATATSRFASRSSPRWRSSAGSP